MNNKKLKCYLTFAVESHCIGYVWVDALSQAKVKGLKMDSKVGCSEFTDIRAVRCKVLDDKLSLFGDEISKLKYIDLAELSSSKPLNKILKILVDLKLAEEISNHEYHFYQEPNEELIMAYSPYN